MSVATAASRGTMPFVSIGHKRNEDTHLDISGQAWTGIRTVVAAKIRIWFHRIYPVGS
jgi:hypothetical protein